MAEYIDREKAKRLLHIEYAYAAEQLLDEIPAADVAPVVRGVWEKEPSSYWRWTSSGAVAVTRTTYRCGLCGRGTAVKSNYCPNCGAIMEGSDS
nr:MAG TPA: zinc-ribbon containing domain protein [Caudoviricetes sp.]